MMRPRTLVFAAAFLGGLTWASGCGEDTTEPPQPPEPLRPTAVTVSPSTAELTAVGETVQLGTEVRDQNGQVMSGVAVTWPGPFLLHRKPGLFRCPSQRRLYCRCRPQPVRRDG